MTTSHIEARAMRDFNFISFCLLDTRLAIARVLFVVINKWKSFCHNFHQNSAVSKPECENGENLPTLHNSRLPLSCRSFFAFLFAALCVKHGNLYDNGRVSLSLCIQLSLQSLPGNLLNENI
jgi:hypothetical protein